MVKYITICCHLTRFINTDGIASSFFLLIKIIVKLKRFKVFFSFLKQQGFKVKWVIHLCLGFFAAAWKAGDLWLAYFHKYSCGLFERSKLRQLKIV